MSVADELEKLANLRDNGALTGDEFQVQKAKILGKPLSPTVGKVENKENHIKEKKGLKSSFPWVTTIIAIIIWIIAININNSESQSNFAMDKDGYIHFKGNIYDISNESLSFSAYDAYDDSYRFDIELSNGFLKKNDGQIDIGALKTFNENCIGKISDTEDLFGNYKEEESICQPIKAFSKTAWSYTGISYTFSAQEGEFYYKQHTYGGTPTFYKLKAK